MDWLRSAVEMTEEMHWLGWLIYGILMMVLLVGATVFFGTKSESRAARVARGVLGAIAFVAAFMAGAFAPTAPGSTERFMASIGVAVVVWVAYNLGVRMQNKKNRQ